jgi:hypothetical protein
MEMAGAVVELKAAIIQMLERLCYIGSNVIE